MKGNAENTSEIIAYHGTDRAGFDRFDISAAGPYNIGLHFGTREAALARLSHLGKERAPSPLVGGDHRAPRTRLLRCRLTLRNPFRIDDVFGHTYAQILAALVDAVYRPRPVPSPVDAVYRPRPLEVDALMDRCMSADDDPRMSDAAYRASYCAEMNAAIIRLFQSLGYDGLVHRNEIESGPTAADSYVIFAAEQATILEEEPITQPIRNREAA